MFGQSSPNWRPGLSKIGGLVNVRIAVADQVEINADVRRSLVKM